jgi:hypothetical protein
MKVSVVVGIALMIAGTVFLFMGNGFTTRRDVLEVGGMSITAVEKHSIDPWIATIALIVGLGLVTQGLRRKA